MKPLRIFAVAAVAVCALSTQAKVWTLDECIGYAIEHNIDVRSRQLQVSTAELDVSDAKNRFLPQASGYASQNFNFGRALTMDNTYANRNTSSFSVGANVSLPIFQGLGAVRRLSYARANLAAMLESAEAAKDDVTLNVIAAYLQALYNRELCAVARERVSMSERDLNNTRELVEAGRKPELDLYQAEAQLAQDKQSAVTASNDSILSLLDLSQLLNLPADEPFDVAALEDAMPPLMTADDVFAAALERNHTLRAAELQHKAAEKNVSVAKTGYIPTISFNAGLGTNYYKTSGMTNEGFGSQMRHNFSQSLGFTLNVPIFDALSTRNSVRRARINSESARLQLDNARLNLYKTINQAYTQALAAYRQQDVTAATVTSTRAAYEAMTVKFDNGRATATELEKAKSDYTNAQTEALRAKYELILRSRILEFYAK